MIDIDRVRADTPAVSDRIHLNNAGGSLMPQPAFAAMLDYLGREQQIGAYETAAERAGDTNRFYKEASILLGCDEDEIAFCESDTRAWLGLFHSISLQPGDQIVTTRLDYGSHFVSFIKSGRNGVETIVIDNDNQGDVDLESLRRAMSNRTRLIVMSHIPTGGGTIGPAAAVGRIAADAGVPFILDACQSLGQVPVNVRDIGCSALTATGRKYLRGPRGTGLLYVDTSLLESLEPAQLDQHGVELIDSQHFRLLPGGRRFENFEVNYAGRVGLGAAMAYANDLGLDAIGERVVCLGRYCRSRLTETPGVKVMDIGSVLGGIVTFSMTGRDPKDIRDYLSANDVNISVSTSTSGSMVDFQARGIESLARASIHYFNTELEIDSFVELLGKMD